MNNHITVNVDQLLQDSSLLSYLVDINPNISKYLSENSISLNCNFEIIKINEDCDYYISSLLGLLKQLKYKDFTIIVEDRLLKYTIDSITKYVFCRSKEDHLDHLKGRTILKNHILLSYLQLDDDSDVLDYLTVYNPEIKKYLEMVRALRHVGECFYISTSDFSFKNYVDTTISDFEIKDLLSFLKKIKDQEFEMIIPDFLDLEFTYYLNGVELTQEITFY